MIEAYCRVGEKAIAHFTLGKDNVSGIFLDGKSILVFTGPNPTNDLDTARSQCYTENYYEGVILTSGSTFKQPLTLKNILDYEIR
ncbi:hypothetical protein AGMMS49942_19710 [Spirochaetia bacterium]|nr:hypothetical protein AGMMS49942_19710 [Spirochaetia bacterium]